MTSRSSNLVDVGRITAVFGVKGWVKIQSFTEPADNLFEYDPWWLKTAHGVKTAEIIEVKPHGKGYIAQLRGVDDRDAAARFAGVTIAVEREQMPELDEGEYYWYQLQGLKVVSRHQNRDVILGRVVRLLETGANDVLIVQGDADSVDQRERLIPYVPGEYVAHVDLAAGTITVDWDPAF